MEVLQFAIARLAGSWMQLEVTGNREKALESTHLFQAHLTRYPLQFSLHPYIACFGTGAPLSASAKALPCR
jgi:hypothetical protein